MKDQCVSRAQAQATQALKGHPGRAAEGQLHLLAQRDRKKGVL